MKDKILILAVFVIVVFSFVLPEWLFKIEDLNWEKRIFSVEKPKSKIDVQAEKIYLVKAIHDINESYRNVKISEREPVYYNDNISYVESASAMTIVQSKEQDENIMNNVKSELLKLENGNILKELHLEKDFPGDDIQMSDFIYSNQENEYILKQVYWKNGAYELKLELEEKTGKILSLYFPKEKFGENSDMEEILRNYIQYLDLYIIDDWEFENHLLKSEKAQLVVALIQNENEYEYVLSIQTMTKYSNFSEKVESAK